MFEMSYETYWGIIILLILLSLIVFPCLLIYIVVSVFVKGSSGKKLPSILDLEK